MNKSVAIQYSNKQQDEIVINFCIYFIHCILWSGSSRWVFKFNIKIIKKYCKFTTGFVPDPNFGRLMSLTWQRVANTPEYREFIVKNGKIENLTLDPEWNSFFSKHWKQVENDIESGKI